MAMGGNHKVEIIVGVKDLASRQLRDIGNAMSSMTKSISGVGTHMSAFSRNLDTAITRMDRMANSMYRMNMHTAALQRNLKLVGGLGVLGAGTMAFQGTNKALAFDYETHKMQARMEVGSGARKEIEKYILDTLNAQVGFGAQDLAQMGTTLAQGGISSVSDMKSMLKTTSYFAEAVDAVPAQAAEMIISAAKGFGISMQDSSQITDKLTVALNKSLLHVEELPHAIGELSGRAKMYGQSFDSSLVALMTGRDQGMSAAQTSQDFLHGLRQLSRIGNDSVLYPKTRSYFEEAGIDPDKFFNKETMQLREFPDIVAAVEEAMVSKGFTNNKYGIKSVDDLSKLAAKHGGKLPDDAWNSMKAMPLISKVFGAAGMAPIMMGLQSSYEEVDKNGEKTGKTYFGSAALKRRYEDVKNSDGAVQGAHDIMADSAQFQLDILKGQWESVQIKAMDNFLPLIKTGSETLTNWLSGGNGKSKDGPKVSGEQMQEDAPKTGLQIFQGSYKEVAQGFRDQGNTTTGNFVEGTGDKIVGGIKIMDALKPLGEQVSKAFGDLFDDSWGDSIVEFPYYLVKNLGDFIIDVAKGSEELNKAIESLPENLQDPARLISHLAKGALIVLAGGAIIKVIELSMRAAVNGLKGVKIGIDLAGWLKRQLDDSKVYENDIDGKDFLKGKSKSTGVMNVKATVVNVYGPGGGDIDLPGGEGKSKSKGRTIITPGRRKGPTPDIDVPKGNKKPPTPKVPPKMPRIPRIGGGPQMEAILLAAPLIYAGSEYAAPKVADAMLKGNKERNARNLEEINRGGLGGPNAEFKAADPGNKPAPGGPTQTMTAKWGNGDTAGRKVTSNDTKVYAEHAKAMSKSVVEAGTNISNTANRGISQIINATSKGMQNTKSGLSGTINAGNRNINGAIVGGFSVANQRLQNIKLNNQVNVSIGSPQVHISGSIKQMVREVQASTGLTKTAAQREVMNGRRIGAW